MGKSSRAGASVVKGGDSASSDLALRCYAPQMVAEAYRRADSRLHPDASTRLGARWQFVDVIQRYLVGVLSADLAGLGIASPSDYLKLLSRLAKPSLGDWGRAAKALAQGILQSKKEAVAPALARLFWSRSGRTWKETEFSKSLAHVVNVRDRAIHDKNTLPSEGEARQYLKDIDADFSGILVPLKILRTFPIFTLEAGWTTREGNVEVQLLRFSGREPERLRPIRLAGSFDVPDKTPFLLTASGRALLLSPHIIRSGTSGEDPEIRLMLDWDPTAKRYSYSCARTHAKVSQGSSEESGLPNPDALGKLTQKMARRDKLDRAACEGLLKHDFDEGLKSFPGFKIIDRIGRGASSEVYLAQEKLPRRAPGRKVALKVLHAAVTLDPAQRLRLAEEHRILSRLQHPSIVKVHGGFREEPSPHLVMDYVQGEDLQSTVERRPLDPDRAARLCLDLLDALALVHRAGVTHRDIKPSNIMVDQEGLIRLIDFGIALTQGLVRNTRTLEALGTAAFAAPEQIAGAKVIDHRADLYAVGRVLEFLVRGDLLAGAQKVVLLPGMQAVIRRATQRDPLSRYRDAVEMRRDLDERMGVGWAGAPVQSGDRLNDSYELHEKLEQESKTKAWIFRGAEIATDENVTLILGRAEGDTGRQLADAARVCGVDVRSQIGYRCTNRTDDGLLFVVLGAENPLENARRFVGGPPSGPTAHDEETPVAAVLGDVLKDRDLDAGDLPGLADKRLLTVPVPPYLEGFAQILRAFSQRRTKNIVGDFLGAFERSRQALQIALAQRHVLSGKALEASAWSTWQGTGFAEHAIKLTGDPGFPSDGSAGSFLIDRISSGVVIGLRKVQLLRNRVVHQMGNEGAIMGEQLLPIFGALLALGCALHQRLADSTRLHPVVTRLPDGGWALLQIQGTKAAYVSLTVGMKDYPIDESTAEWIGKSKEELPLSNLAVRGVMKEMHETVWLDVKKVLQTIPEVFEILEEPEIAWLGRRARPDAVVMLRDDKPLCVVETAFMGYDLRRNGAAKIAQVYGYAMAFGAPFALISDGTTFHWFAVDSSEGLKALPDDALVRSYAARYPAFVGGPGSMFMIDGYNFVHSVVRGQSSTHDRDRVISRIEHWCRKNDYRARIIFGATNGKGRREERGGLEIQTVADGRSVEQEILAGLSRMADRRKTTVVSNDRVIVNASDMKGFRSLPCEELARLISIDEGNEDVEFWMHEFGLDKDASP